MAASPALHRLTEGLVAQGVDLSSWRPAFLLRRLQRSALLSGDVFLDRHVERLLGSDDALGTFLSDLSIGVSAFFRDPLPFAALEEMVVRDLAREPAAPPRVLSVGCARGQEAWSVAMLLAERFPRFGVVGLDRHPGLLTEANEGTYNAAELESVTVGRLKRFFIADGEQYGVNWELRPSVSFEEFDFGGGELPPWVEPASTDLVLCRNVFIYLQREMRGRLLDAIARALRPRGALMLGPADEMPERPDFVRLCDRAGLYRRNGK
jgi:two-component system CheB/CheR fusion protein